MAALGWLLNLGFAAGAGASASVSCATPVTSDWTFPTLGANYDDGTGDAWTNASNLFADDAAYSVNKIAVAQTDTQLIYTSGFGFTIPSGATILGIELRIEKSRSNNNHTFDDRTVRLFDNTGVPLGSNKQDNVNWPTTGSAPVDYGSPSDLWGATWTPAIVNATSFGAGIATVWNNGSGLSNNAQVDYMQIRVTYCNVVTSVVLEGVLDGQSVSIPDSVTDNRFTVGAGGVSIRRVLN